MIITLSGSQGQGKSTVLSSLEQNGFGVVPNKTARTILNEWGCTLMEVYKDGDLTVKFHDEIIECHEKLCRPYCVSDDIMFIERSYADIFAYALAVLGPYNEYSGWLNQFYEKCSKLQANFSAVLYLTGRDYTPQADGVRSTNIHFAKAIDTSIQKYSKDFRDKTHTHKMFIIDTPDHEERLIRITNIIKTYFED